MTENKKRRISDRTSRFASFFGEGLVFTGSFAGDSDCVVFGRVEGDCDVRATVVVQKGAVWKGSIVADHVVVSGEVQGDVTARSQLELTASARVRGNITGASIAIAEGALFDGEIRTTSRQEVNWFKERRRTQGEGDS